MKLSHLAGAALLALVASSMAILALTSTGAHAADLPTGPMGPEASAVSAWDGGYLGINVGYGPGIALSTDNNFSGLTSGELDFSGWFLGGQAGYNFSFGNGIVAGLEGDINWTNESGSK